MYYVIHGFASGGAVGVLDGPFDRATAEQVLSKYLSELDNDAAGAWIRSAKQVDEGRLDSCS